MRRLAALCAALVVLLVTGCGQAGRTPEQQGEEPSVRQEATAKTGESARGATKTAATAVPETTPDEPGEEKTAEATAGTGKEASNEASAGEAPFTAEPEARGGDPGAAGSIAEVRHGVHEGYERLVVEFESGDGPATGPPEWRFESPTGEGYGRITFPGLESTAVSDGDPGGNPGGSVMDDFYVVRAPDGGFFLDLFATGAFQYRILELRDPGRLAIDYRPAGVELDYPLPVRGERNVVAQPRAGVSSPLTVAGYSRNFEASTTIVLRGRNGETLARETVQANDWAGTWGYFETALEFPAFDGEATLLVGSESARDGTFEGVEVPVSGG